MDFLFFEIFYLFIFRERGRKEEGERTINISVREKCWWAAPQPRHVPWPGIEPRTFWFTGWGSSHWATPARAGMDLICACICNLVYWSPEGHILARKPVNHRISSTMGDLLLNQIVGEQEWLQRANVNNWGINQFHSSKGKWETSLERKVGVMLAWGVGGEFCMKWAAVREWHSSCLWWNRYRKATWRWSVRHHEHWRRCIFTSFDLADWCWESEVTCTQIYCEKMGIFA